MITLIFPHVLLRIYKVICLLGCPGRYLNYAVKTEKSGASSPPGLQKGQRGVNVWSLQSWGSRHGEGGFTHCRHNPWMVPKYPSQWHMQVWRPHTPSLPWGQNKGPLTRASGVVPLGLERGCCPDIRRSLTWSGPVNEGPPTRKTQVILAASVRIRKYVRVCAPASLHVCSWIHAGMYCMCDHTHMCVCVHACMCTWGLKGAGYKLSTGPQRSFWYGSSCI